MESFRSFADGNSVLPKGTIQELEATLVEPFSQVPIIKSVVSDNLRSRDTLPNPTLRNLNAWETYTNEMGRNFRYYVWSNHFQATDEQTIFIGVATANSENRITNFIHMVCEDIALRGNIQVLLGICVNSSSDSTLSEVVNRITALLVPAMVFYIPDEEFGGLSKCMRIATAKNVMYHYIATHLAPTPDYWVGIDDDIVICSNGSSVVCQLVQRLASYKLVSGSFAVTYHSRLENEACYLLSVHKLPDVIHQSPPRPIAYGALFAMRFNDYIPIPTRDATPDDVFWTMTFAASHLKSHQAKRKHGQWPVTTLPEVLFVHRGKQSLREWIENKEGILLSAREMSTAVGEGYLTASRRQAEIFQRYWRAVQSIIVNRFGSQSVEYAAHLYAYHFLLPLLVRYWREEFWYFYSPYPEAA